MTMKNTRTILGLTLAGMMAMAGTASAGDFSLNLGFGSGHGGDHFGLGLHFGDSQPLVAAPPVVVQQPVLVQPQRVWVPPTYRVVSERVWVPTVRTAYRDVPVIGPHGQVVSYRREPYTVRSGHWVTVRRQVPVGEGQWRTVDDPDHFPRRYPSGGAHGRRTPARATPVAWAR
jgi:hypothetical protein